MKWNYGYVRCMLAQHYTAFGRVYALNIVSAVHPGDAVNGSQRGAADKRERVNAKRCEERNEGEKDGLAWPSSHGPCRHVSQCTRLKRSDMKSVCYL